MRVGPSQSVFGFEEEDWLNPGPEQCDIFTLPSTEEAQCEISHPNNTQTGVLIERVTVQDVLWQIISWLTVYSVCGVILASGIIFGGCTQKW